MRNRHVMLFDFHYLGVYMYVHNAYNSHFGGQAMIASKRPQNSNFTSELKSANSITLVHVASNSHFGGL